MDTTSSTGTSPTTTTGTGNGAAGNAQKVVERVAQTAHDTIDRVAAAAGPAIDKLRGGATTATETLQAKADQLGALEEQWIASARSYVREHPLQAVAIAALAGLLIGKMSGGRE